MNYKKLLQVNPKADLLDETFQPSGQQTKSGIVLKKIAAIEQDIKGLGHKS